MFERNFQKIVKRMIGALPSGGSSKISPTTLNNIIATASLIIPSPNTMENNLGYLLGLIIVKAATESEAQIVALYLIINPIEIEKGCFQSE